MVGSPDLLDRIRRESRRVVAERRLRALCEQVVNERRLAGNSNPEGYNQYTGPGCSGGETGTTVYHGTASLEHILKEGIKADAPKIYSESVDSEARSKSIYLLTANVDSLDATKIAKDPNFKEAALYAKRAAGERDGTGYVLVINVPPTAKLHKDEHDVNDEFGSKRIEQDIPSSWIKGYIKIGDKNDYVPRKFDVVTVNASTSLHYLPISTPSEETTDD